MVLRNLVTCMLNMMYEIYVALLNGMAFIFFSMFSCFPLFCIYFWFVFTVLYVSHQRNVVPNYVLFLSCVFLRRQLYWHLIGPIMILEIKGPW